VVKKADISTWSSYIVWQAMSRRRKLSALPMTTFFFFRIEVDKVDREYINHHTLLLCTLGRTDINEHSHAYYTGAVE